MCARAYQTQLALQSYCTLPHHLAKIIFPPYDIASSHPHKTHKLQGVQVGSTFDINTTLSTCIKTLVHINIRARECVRKNFYTL